MNINTSRKEGSVNQFGWLVFILSVLLTLPWIGLGNFYTRGEPREALVAVEMLEQGNFILPFFQGEFAFKPPMLHWLVALFSLPQGYVSEITARLPSALACIVMCCAFYSFVSKRFSPSRSFYASLILMSCFEVHRAAMTCRVDMVLTMFIVLAFLALYHWYEKGYKGMPWLASLAISGAILTKGPIGAILPCFALFVFMLFYREKWSRILLVLVKISLLSVIIPLVWYVAAYRQGGDVFLRLVMEENFGRFLGKMSYESHENTFLVNFVMIASGMLPWSLLVVLGLVTAKWSRLKSGKKWIAEQWQRFRVANPLIVFTVVAAVCVFVFYCIPASKRSVYLLPMYPFMSLLMANYMVDLYLERKKILKIYAVFLAVVSLIYIALLYAVHFMDLSVLGTSRGARRLIAQMTELQTTDIGFLYIVLTLLPTVVAVAVLAGVRHWKNVLFGVATLWLLVTLTLDGLLLPAIKNSVPGCHFARSVKTLQPEGDIYFFRPAGQKEEAIYTVSFYLGDCVVSCNEETAYPEKGFAMFRETNKDKFLSDMAAKGYQTEEKLRTLNEFTSIRCNILLYEFSKIKE